ncbi:unnamed protein product, partial [Brugia timori]|uniref:DUF2510 domain-containing protein n=1 Tax=Brugia timori TaxID=42155 RepID=A0A0R3QHQ6_9BILA
MSTTTREERAADVQPHQQRARGDAMGEIRERAERPTIFRSEKNYVETFFYLKLMRLLFVRRCDETAAVSRASNCSHRVPHYGQSQQPFNPHRRPRVGAAHLLRLIVVACSLAASYSFAAKVTEYQAYGNGWLGGQGSGWQSNEAAACARMVGVSADVNYGIYTYISSVPTGAGNCLAIERYRWSGGASDSNTTLTVYKRSVEATEPPVDP